jgi:hypothetical protein
MGEYYTFTGFDDHTGVAPFYDVDYFAPADPFWNAHTDFWGDPLLRTAWDNFSPCALHRTGNGGSMVVHGETAARLPPDLRRARTASAGQQRTGEEREKGK